MYYHNITKVDMNNGDGLRVVLWLSGCSHHCKGCQNPQTWNSESGIPFDDDARQELFEELSKDYISGITFSGGDPLYKTNIPHVARLISDIAHKFPSKTIWVYTGYTWEQLMDLLLVRDKEDYLKSILKFTDVLVDGRFKKDLADINYLWAGSTNQRVIDVQKSLSKNKIVLYNN